MAIVQGDEYKVAVQIVDSEENVIEPSDVEKIQFQFGEVIKEYVVSELEYDDLLEAYLVPLSESETYSLDRVVKYQVRVKFSNGDIKGSEVSLDYLYDSIIRKEMNGK